MEPIQRTVYSPLVSVPRIWLTRATSQIIATGTSVPIQWTAANYQNLINWNLGDPTKIRIIKPGLYVFTGGMQWDGNATGTYRYNYILKNGTLSLGAAGQVPSAAGLAQRTGPITSPATEMNVNDYVEYIALHDVGSDRNLDNGMFSAFALQLF